MSQDDQPSHFQKNNLYNVRNPHIYLLNTKEQLNWLILAFVKCPHLASRLR